MLSQRDFIYSADDCNYYVGLENAHTFTLHLELPLALYMCPTPANMAPWAAHRHPHSAGSALCSRALPTLIAIFWSQSFLVWTLPATWSQLFLSPPTPSLSPRTAPSDCLVHSGWSLSCVISPLCLESRNHCPSPQHGVSAAQQESPSKRPSASKAPLGNVFSNAARTDSLMQLLGFRTWVCGPCPLCFSCSPQLFNGLYMQVILY